MKDSKISLKPVKELLGMNFFIPDYQRGYRWEKQQAIDLLEDIYAFAKEVDSLNESDRIYCIQPLVVSKKGNDNEIIGEILKECEKDTASLEDIKKLIKGTWTVVDGQQRLTTIKILLSYLGESENYSVEYQTRDKSEEYLKNITNSKSSESNENIDFYHMYKVYETIKSWFEDKERFGFKESFKDTLLNRVHFIWYEIDKEEEIKVFTRLNIGKIPLTDAELIKALFLNRTNFSLAESSESKIYEARQREIALEWDQIEQTLQNDEFWLFLNNTDYSRPTRIDFILDMICERDNYTIYEYTNYKKTNRKGKEKNKQLEERIGHDEHKTFRYFNEAFKSKCKPGQTEWLTELWQEIKRYYQVFLEWYNDYRLYHYIGYITAAEMKIDIADLVAEWQKYTKEDYIQYLKGIIKNHLKNPNWFVDLKENEPKWKFDEEYEGKRVEKRECVKLLLLHNIETMIQQNDKLVEDKDYNLPNFTKFPFHLFKKEKWQVEHIRPDAGDNFNGDNIKLYLSLAKEYFVADRDLTTEIDKFISGREVNIEELISKIYEYGDVLEDEDKNKIWNFVLLDESTNKEYGNQIFSVKRAFVINKKNGKKVKYRWKNEALDKSEFVKEVAFVPPCTENVFSKFYTPMPTTMINWNREDAKNYWKDIKEKLAYYITEG